MSIARRGLLSCRQRLWPQRPPSTAILLIQLVYILQLLRPSNVVVHGLQLGIFAKRRPVSRILPKPHGVVTVPLRQTSLYPRCLESSSPTTLYYRNDATVHNDTLLIDPCDNLITTLDHPWDGSTIYCQTTTTLHPSQSIGFAPTTRIQIGIVPIGSCDSWDVECATTTSL
jgi:hypothetical protein